MTGTNIDSKYLTYFELVVVFFTSEVVFAGIAASLVVDGFGVGVSACGVALVVDILSLLIKPDSSSDDIEGSIILNRMP